MALFLWMRVGSAWMAHYTIKCWSRLRERTQREILEQNDFEHYENHGLASFLNSFQQNFIKRRCSSHDSRTLAVHVHECEG
jgi:hypothetical protein